MGARVTALYMIGETLYLASPKGVLEVELVSLASRLVLPLALGSCSSFLLLRGPLALLHTPREVILLFCSSPPRHLPVPGAGSSSPDGKLVTRLGKDGLLAFYRVEEVFTEVPETAPTVIVRTQSLDRLCPKSPRNGKKQINTFADPDRLAELALPKYYKVISKPPGKSPAATNNIPKSPTITSQSLPSPKRPKSSTKEQQEDQLEALAKMSRESLLPMLQASCSPLPDRCCSYS